MNVVLVAALLLGAIVAGKTQKIIFIMDGLKLSIECNLLQKGIKKLLFTIIIRLFSKMSPRLNF